jgi:pimeloyl-ACP methyl ester carboxylesterase
MPRLPRLLAATLMLAAGACVSPAADLNERARALGLDRQVVTGTGFDHVIYRNRTAPTTTLHFYLDGDGVPRIAGRPADDPTPRNSLTLRLMALDPLPAAYLGRPCYHGLTGAAACRGELWTSARYSEPVVASMAAVARRLIEAQTVQRIAWFGHSGGGALAMLLAERLPETTAVITIGANLDTDAWAASTGQHRLNSSLNPAIQPPLRADIRQRHYVGGRDRVVPPAVTLAGLVGSGAEVIVIDDYDHVCCWERIWPEALASVAGDVPGDTAIAPGLPSAVRVVDTDLR